MNKNEQDMIRKIKEKSEQVPVPKALEPRQIEAKLAGKKKKVWTPARIGGLAAACLVLIVGEPLAIPVSAVAVLLSSIFCAASPLALLSADSSTLISFNVLAQLEVYALSLS